MTTTPKDVPPTIDIDPNVPIQVFDDVRRALVDSTILLTEITAIADHVSEHYGFQRAIRCVRVQLGPGKWAYVSAVLAAPLRQSWIDWKAAHPTPPAPPVAEPPKTKTK